MYSRTEIHAFFLLTVSKCRDEIAAYKRAVVACPGGPIGSVVVRADWLR